MLESAIKAINLNEVNQINSNITTAKNIIESIKSSFEIKKGEFNRNFMEAKNIGSQVADDKALIIQYKQSIDSISSDISSKKELIDTAMQTTTDLSQQIAVHNQNITQGLNNFNTENAKALQKLYEIRKICLVLKMS